MSGDGEALREGIRAGSCGGWAVPAALVLLSVAIVLGCGRPAKPRDVCFEIRASQNLNTYSSQAHVVVVDLHPLETAGGFEQLSATDLISGTKPAGSAGAPIQMTFAPGEQREVRETFPADTKFIGLVADYYRAPGSAEGTRKLVTPAACGRFGKTVVVLSSNDLLLEE